MKRILLILTLLLISLHSIAQSFPVQLTPQVMPPYPVYVSDYANTSSVQDKVKLQVILNDLTVNVNQIRLKLYIQGEGITTQSNDLVIGTTPIFLEGGIPTLLGTSELAAYFEFQNLQGITPNTYGNALPEGIYQICFEAYDFFTNNVLSAKTCSTIVLFQNNPPLLNLPLNESVIQEQNPLNIVFQWTPRHINVSNVQYEFSLVEIWDNYIDPQAAFLSSPPIFKTTLSETTLIYGPAFPQLLTGKKYAWNVRAFALDGIEEVGVFTNQGNSEIYWFSFQTPCDTPLFPEVEELSDHHAKLIWQGANDHIDYTIKYREKNASSDWYELTTPRTYITINDLNLESTYEYKILGNCDYGSFGETIIYEFTTLSEQASAYIGCNIEPDPADLSNQNMLPELFVNDIITAGDFPITILELYQSYAPSSGEGYVVLPWLGDTKIRVTFTDIFVNTDSQLVDGVVKSYYDSEWNNVVEIPNTQDIEDLLEIFGPSDDIVYEDAGTTGAGTTGAGTTGAGTTDTGTTDTGTTDTGTTDIGTTNIGTTDIGTTDTETTGTGTTGTGTTGTGTTNETNNVFIVYNGNDYSDGDIIEVPYNENETNFAFLLKDYPENATFNWQVLSIGTDVTNNYAQNETIYDNLGIDTGNKQILDIVANYNDEKIKITLKRRSQFVFQNLVAIPADNNKRKAYNDETLYLINHNFNNKRNINYGIVTNPNLPNGAISSQDIAWYYKIPNKQTNLGTNFGKRNLHLSLTKDTDNDFLVSVEAGNPNSLNKNVNVKWIDRDFSKDKSIFDNGINLLPQLEQLAQKLGVPIYHDKTNFDQPGSLGILSDIKYDTTTQNKEDDESRLVYNEKKESFTVSLGVKVGFEKPIPNLAIPKVDKTFLGVTFKLEAGLYFFMDAKAYGEIGSTKYTEDWIEQKQKRNREYVKALDPAIIRLNASIGLDPKIVVEAGDNMEVYVSGKSFAYAEIVNYNLIDNQLTYPVLDNGFQLKCTPSARIKLWKWNYTHQFDEYIYYVNW